MIALVIVVAILQQGSPELTAEDPNSPAFLIGKELRCPVCQGMPIADSPSEMAQDMMHRVRSLLKEGKTREEIFAYFAASYGEWVVLRPSIKGLNSVVWLLPPVLLIATLFGIGRYLKKRQKQKAPHATNQNHDDSYLAMVRREVER